MTMIKKYKEFCESISGTMDLAPFGPGSPRAEFPPTMGQKDTTVLFSNLNQEFYTEDDYLSLYQDYLKKGFEPLQGGFNLENLEIVLQSL